MRANSIDDVLIFLDEIIHTSKAERSRIGFFAALYRQVTLKILAGMNHGFFDDNQRMNHFSAEFANRYFDALIGYREGEFVTKSWEIAFTATNQTDVIILQHLLLGINAHINLDLGIVAAQICPGDKLKDFQHDFQGINTLLIDILEDVQGVVNQFSPLLDILDRVGGRKDEEIIKFSFKKARAQAWKVAEYFAVLSADEQIKRIQELDEKIAFLGQIIISPSRIIDKALDLIKMQEDDDVVKIIDGLNLV
ncbi:DUF5995 family protein [Calothrix sp. NIES-3974]|uniref:DUF5995 family protein n=1 Tax=Calothrix sp. NIES-3974 TaxID=2005462 RepID=UPI000B5FBA45|nr:DUF5995 family protein [Calothrix sp. NIES-3974]BAZ03784.1 hypothetical protein NIES3974_04140 [Calothrix sp. NIES-3974]